MAVATSFVIPLEIPLVIPLAIPLVIPLVVPVVPVTPVLLVIPVVPVTPIFHIIPVAPGVNPVVPVIILVMLVMFLALTSLTFMVWLGMLLFLVVVLIDTTSNSLELFLREFFGELRGLSEIFNHLLRHVFEHIINNLAVSFKHIVNEFNGIGNFDVNKEGLPLSRGQILPVLNSKTFKELVHVSDDASNILDALGVHLIEENLLKFS